MTTDRFTFTICVVLMLSGLASGESITQTTWNEVIEDGWADSGTLGGVSIDLSTNSTQLANSLVGSDWPTIIEVYTATWCTNCVQTEHAMNEAIAEENVVQVHYHRFIAETQDPFGAQSTDDHWVERYGATSKSIAGAERLAPSNVFDGERFHIGTSSKSDSVQQDFEISNSVGSSIDFSSFSASLAWTSEAGASRFAWNISTNLSDEFKINPMLFFVEEEGHFPEGGNGEEYYHHILRDVVDLTSLSGEQSIDFNGAYDGDDMSAILVFDWFKQLSETSNFPKLPAPGWAVLIPLFGAALLPRRDD